MSRPALERRAAVLLIEDFGQPRSRSAAATLPSQSREKYAPEEIFFRFKVSSREFSDEVS